ncbi:hypothetical protein Slin_0176 [Spirosoma linguale DSM 74]|uniref:Uncharacterized protein n=1 Tax=Spirosoma linguale (strain ATCC 33905 / DSM 74 / LMG 10896 / Claus 1) TaxID=504472 RepID=D2QCD0_SPILD|nr:hypothetical protein Slin_0176 [Spirosoma linguale DSM 74]
MASALLGNKIGGLKVDPASPYSLIIKKLVSGKDIRPVMEGDFVC